MKTFTFWIAALALAGSAVAETIDRQAALDAVVAAEVAFAKTSAEKGTKEAFLAFLAPDSVLFRPRPVAGRDSVQEQPESPSRLTWRPVYGDVSLAGDLGWTTGPWEHRAKPDDPKVSHGYYVTLWKKQADGSFKVATDIGTSNPPPASAAAAAIPPASPARVEAEALPKVDAEAVKAELLEADRAFSRASEEKGAATAYAETLTEGARLYRNGSEPVVGREAIRAALTAKTLLANWKPEAAVVSSSGDLGYTHGTVQVKEGAGGNARSNYYLRIWNKLPDAGWRVALDVFQPLPAAPKPRKIDLKDLEKKKQGPQPAPPQP
jgi:ketosteroid isomerase-like protein